ncbi:MAG TPA: hypothetical protein VFK19_01010 [Sphingomicrobium sp.]|nr:hypothetical protein [Sphingomicrobium sp.]
MTTGRMIELGVAVVLLAASVFLYRRKPVDDGSGPNSYGNQGAVLLFVVAAIMAIHALGALDYHPTKAEADMMRSGSR